MAPRQPGGVRFRGGLNRRRKAPAEPAVTAAAAVGSTGTRRRARWLLSLAVVALSVSALVWAAAQQQRGPRVYGYQVVRDYPHDAAAYTQGLVFHNGLLYEGTGKYGQSTLRKVELQTGRVLDSRALTGDLFGEGITVKDGRIYQLTWKQGVAPVYDADSLQELHRFRYRGEGWGLTHDGTHLIMSNGSSTLQFLDPQTFRVVRQLPVRSQGRRVDKLNELEYIGGQIYANIWYQDHLARISPETGEVTGWVDLRGLWAGRRDPDSVLNGIAYDQEHDRLFVTGKNWPRVFEIRLVEP